MKILQTVAKEYFGDIKPGEVFCTEQGAFMKISQQGHGVNCTTNCVNLLNGDLFCYTGNDVLVTPKQEAILNLEGE